MTTLAQAQTHFPAGLSFFTLFTVLVVAAIVASLLSRNSRTVGKVMLIVAFAVALGMTWLSSARHRRSIHQDHEVRRQAQAERTYAVAQIASRDGLAGLDPGQFVPDRPLDARLDPGDVAGAISAPNDLADWERDRELGFQPEHDWSDELSGSGLRVATVGETKFIFWQPSSAGRLVGFSGKEADREDAYRAAVRSAADKLAVLGLKEIKRRKRKVDAHAAWPLARQLAASMLHEESKQFETAHRGYGDLHRAAVSVLAGGEEVDSLASAIGEEIERGWIARQRDVRSWFLAAGAALIAGFAIFLFYAFANAGTKGYFAWPLRIASLGLFALLCAGIYYVRLKIGLG